MTKTNKTTRDLRGLVVPLAHSVQLGDLGPEDAPLVAELAEALGLGRHAERCNCPDGADADEYLGNLTQEQFTATVRAIMGPLAGQVTNLEGLIADWWDDLQFALARNMVECPHCEGDGEEPGAAWDPVAGIPACCVCNGRGQVTQEIATAYHERHDE